MHKIIRHYDILTSAEKTPGIDDRRIKVAEAKIDRFIMLFVLLDYILLTFVQVIVLFGV